MREFKGDEKLIRTVYGLTRWVSRYFDVKIHDLDRIPSEGAALLVSNHALMAVDTWAFLPELFHQHGRVPRGMGLRALFDVPYVERFLREMGMEAGERATAVELLRAGEMVVTYPGGARDALKTKAERFDLKWDGRRGFAHVAIQAGAPVVPVAGVGPDECFPVLLDQGLIPCDRIGMEAHKAPLFVPLARRVPFDFFVGSPLTPPPVPEGASEDELIELADAFAWEVRERTQELLKEGHARRSGARRRTSRRESVRRGLGAIAGVIRKAP